MNECKREDLNKMNQNQQELPSRKHKGGLITMPFIIANEAFEKVASYGLLPNMIFYLLRVYKMGVTRATNVIFLWSAATNFMPLIGAFLADSFLGRFLTIGLGSIASLLGMILLWLTAMVSKESSSAASPAQYTLLIFSFGLISIGAGGIRPCSLAFGADQLDKRENPNNDRVLESFFSWYYASAAVSVLIALTGIVYVQDHAGWKVGFGVPAILMLASTLLFFIASSLYVKQTASKSLFTGFAQVLVVACKNRNLDLPMYSSSLYHRETGSQLTAPTDKLRFLNKACVIKNPEVVSKGWNVCTIEQVEELKTLIRVIPIWSTGIMVSINISQSSFPLLQASSMDRHITSSFEIPAGSFGMFTIITIMVWVVLYDRVMIPLASRLTGKKVHLGVKLRMGVGIFFSCMAMVVSGIVEHIRRRKAIEQGLLNSPHEVVNMSAMWLIPQNILSGLAEAFNAIGQTEFYYSEFPKSMSSIASSLFGVGMAIANLLASVVLSSVDRLTRSQGKESWVSSNINKGHYEYYYWLLAIMTFINLIYFLVCSWAYGSCVDKVVKTSGEGNGLEEEKSSLPGATPSRAC